MPPNMKFISMISLIGLAYLVSIVIAMHKLRPDLDARSRYISEYAVGPYGWLAKGSFLAYGVAILGVYLGLQAVLPVRTEFSLGLTLLAISGVTKVIMSFFNTDLKHEKMSLHGSMHTIASSVGVAASAIGSIFLSFKFPLDKSTESISFVTQMVAIVGSILVALLFIGLLGDLAVKYDKNIPRIILRLASLTGISERLLLGISVVWFTVLAVWILNR